MNITPAVGERLKTEYLRGVCVTLLWLALLATCLRGADAEPAAMRLRAPLDMRRMTVAQYNGAVSSAMEAMRLVQEPMSAEESKRFEERWAAQFNLPNEAAMAYFNALIPLLDEFLMLRGVIAETARAIDEGWVEAKYAAAYESETGTRGAMELVARRTELLRGARARLVELVEAIAKLGNPPDPVVARAAARKRHEEATKVAAQLVPNLTLTPAKLVGAPGVPVTIIPKGRNMPAGATIAWKFGDGKTEAGKVTTTKHTYSKEGRYELKAEARDKGGKAVAEARTEVVITAKGAAPMKGVWVLKEVKLQSPERWDRWIIQKTIVDSEGMWDVKGGDVTYENSKTMAKEHTGERTIKARWKHPPLKGTPGQLVEMPWTLVAKGGLIGSSIQFNPSWSKDDAKVANSDRFGNSPTTPNATHPGNGTFRFKFPAPLPHAPTAKFDLWVGCASSGYSEGCVGTGGSRHYEYVFVPEGEQAEALLAQATDPAQRALERAKQQATEEHRNNIVAIERVIEGQRADLARARDDRARADLEFQIRSAEAQIQAERDLITSIETGRYVHTRTAWDEVAHAQFVGNIREQQQRLGAILKVLDRADRLIAVAPSSEQERMRGFARRQLTAELVTKMDLKRAQRAMQAIGAQVQGYYQGESAKQDEKAAWKNYGLEATENIKAAADAGMMVTSMFGGQSINLLYQAGTGYVEGGPVEAVKRAATTYSDAIDYAVTAYDGYRAGGLEGAGKELAWKYVQDKTLSWVAGKVASRGAGADGKRVALQEQFEAARFKQEREWGEALVRDFQRAQLEIETAGRRGAAPEQIMQLQAAARDKAAAVASSLHAKNYLKYKCDGPSGKAYDAHMRAIHAEVDVLMKQQMGKDGWNVDDWELREFRNSSSYGKPNMDRDVGLREKPLWELDDAGEPLKGKDGNLVPNPERWEVRAGQRVLKPQVMKGKKPASLHQWETEAGAAYARAYRDVTRRSSTMAMEGVTTSVHPEAYKDMAWLGDDKTRVSVAWAAQAADVTRFKVKAPGHADPTASYFTKMQEVARGTSKDLETKLLPVLEGAKPQGANAAALKRSEDELAEAKRHWRKINSVLSAYGRNEIDPIQATHRLRELTGGKSLPELVDELGTFMEATVKFGR